MADLTMNNAPQRGSGLDPIVQEAMERWERCNKWESATRKLFLDDYKFSNADSDNGFQWPNSIRRLRDVDERPCLTINKTRQHNLNIINDAKQNKQAIKIMPTGNGATFESGQVLSSVMRHVEYRSNAAVAYDTATSFCVQAGIGYVRIKTEWEKGTFYQNPSICRVDDPLTIFMDPDAKELDKSDMKFCFVFEDMQIDEFKKKHPKWAKYAANATIGNTEGWLTDDRVRITEYFRKEDEDITLFQYADSQGKPTIVSSTTFDDDSEILAALKRRVKEKDPSIRSRPDTKTTIEYKFIVGTTLVEEEIFPGEFIPIVPMIAEETVIEGVLDRKGHTRALKDAQRMYNYWTSTAVEYGALQTKTPWIAPAEAIEDYEVYWNNANRVNNAVLPYNALADDGTTVIPPPTRVQPPVAAPVALQGMQTASTEMMMVSGQYENTMGEQGNERTGAAIDARQRQGDRATYHYIDAQGVMIRQVGRILLGLTPILFDTPRVMNIMAESGMSYELQIDPTQQQPFMARLNHDMQTVQQVLLNPNVGKYDVQADTGPNYGTKRKEAAQALTLILTQAPQLAGVIGDLMIKAMDFPLGDEAAARLRRLVPPHALGTGPTPQEQALTEEMQKLQGVLQATVDELAKTKISLKGKDAKRDVDVFNALTARLKLFMEGAKSKPGTAEKPGEPPVVDLDSEDFQALFRQAWEETMNVSLDPVVDATAPTLEEAAGQGNNRSLPNGTPRSDQPPFPGAKKGADGGWYQRDFSNSDAYRRIF